MLKIMDSDMRHCTREDMQEFPELELFDSVSDREDAWKQAGKRVFLRWSYAVYALIVLVLHGVLKDHVASRLPIPELDHVTTIIGAAALMFALIGGWMWMRRRRIHAVLREALREKGVPVCMHCGYCLRGAALGRCAECGHEDGGMK